jgi:hypothetical protein
MDDKVRKNKVDWKHWLHMPQIRIRQAVALSMDIEPDKMPTYHMDGLTYSSSAFQNKEEQDEFHKRCRQLVNNAFSNKNICSADGLLTSTPQGQNYSAEIYLEYFPEWALSVEWDIPKELKALVDPKNLPAQEETAGEEIYALFDSLPRKAITQIFYDKKINWEYSFKRAPDNGLRELREDDDLYNPAKVGDWLVKKSKLTFEQSRKTLVKELPTRSLGKEYLIIPDYDK